MKKAVYFFCLLLSASLYASSLEVPKLTLNASATIWKPADELQLKIGIVTLHTTAEQALFENSSKMNAVINHIEAAGLTKEDYETSNFSIHPTYTPTPHHPPHDWKPSINGYEVTNTLLIHTDKLNLIGKIIDLANGAGANQISDIRFGLKNPRQYWAEALSAAGSNAVHDAETIAASTGVRLVRVLSISLHNTQVHGRELSMACMAKACGAQPTPIEPSDVSIVAHVSVVYEIN